MEHSHRGPLQPCTFDADYVSRLVEGDSNIEDHFITYFGQLLSIKLRARVRSRETIEDVRQETFARVFRILRQKGGLKHPERLGGFVNSVCNKVLFERFREDKKYAPMSADADAWPDIRIAPDEPLVNQERKRLIEKVLSKLRRRDRELLRLVLLEEMDKEEACQRFGVSEGYLRVMLHRAMLRFRKELMKQSTPAARRFILWNQRDGVKQSSRAVHYSMGYSDET